jgi:hypothetical protein
MEPEQQSMGASFWHRWFAWRPVFIVDRAGVGD